MSIKTIVASVAATTAVLIWFFWPYIELYGVLFLRSLERFGL